MAGSDLYAALLGEAPNSAEKQAALADILRRRAGLAQVAQLSGDPTLAPMGQQQGREVNDQAQQIQQAQQQQAQMQARQAQAAQQMQFQQAQEARQAAGQQQQLALTQRGQDLTAGAALTNASLRAQEIEAAKTTAANKPPTDAQAGARAYLGRMQEAEKLLGDYSPSTKDFVSASNIYGGGGALKSTMANKFMSKEGQKYYQAAADWVRAKLRKESGASISPTEMESELRTYFPLPGEPKEVITQKAAARQAAEGELATMGNIPKPVAAPKRVKVDAQGNVIGN